MTNYTPEYIHSMSDSELCEAISTRREEKPNSNLAACYGQLKGNWIMSIDFNKPTRKYIPTNWLLPENWTRLMDEKKISVGWWPPDNQWHVYNDIAKYDWTGTNRARLVCELWLLCQEVKE